MSAKTFGIAHLYGVKGSITNAKVLSFSKDDSFAQTDQTPNESGQIIERRYDDITEEVSITIRMQSGYSEPAIGTLLVYDSVTYEITGKGRAEEAQGFRTLTLKVKKSEYITYS